MDVRTLLTKWGFDVDSKPLKKVEDQLEAIKHRLEFLAAVEVVKGLAELTERFSKFAEELSVAAESAGITVEAFQKLSFAAGMNAVTTDEMAAAMARLSRNLYDARNGSEEAQKTFSRAGFTNAQIAGFHTGADALAALSDRFKGMKDPIQKQAIAMELLGRGSRNMVAFLSQGSAAIREQGIEAQKLGAILTTEQVVALRRAEEAFNKLWAVVKAFSATIASYFSPEIEAAIDELLHFYEVNQKIIQSSLKAWVGDISYAMGYLWGIVKFVAGAFFDFAKTHELLVRRLGELIFGLGVLVTALLAVGTAMKGLKSIVTATKEGFGTLKDIGAYVFRPLLWATALVQKALVWIALQVATLASTAFPALSEAILAFGAFLEATPVGWFLTAIVAITLAVQALWAHFVQGKDWKDTWIGKMIGGIGELMDKIVVFMGLGKSAKDLWENMTGKDTMIGRAVESVFPSKVQSAQETTQLGKVPSPNWLDNLTSVSGITGNVVPNGISAAAAAPAAVSTSVEVNAPVTINVPAGTDPKMVGQRVQDGVKEHFDRVMREASRSTKGAAAY